MNAVFKSPFLNWIFKTPALGSRADPEAYAEWEFQNAGHTLTCFKPYDDIRDKSILDVGCGFGGKSTFYALHGAEQVTAIDLDNERIEAAREFAEKKNVDNICFEIQDAASLGFTQEQFDLVIFSDSFEHVHDPTDVLKECYRVLRRGGTANIMFPPYASAWGAHLFAHIPIPWVQFLFGEEDLVHVWKKEFDRDLEKGALVHSQQRMEAIHNARTVCDLAHLNRMSIEQYERILNETEFKTRFYRVHTPGILLPFLASSKWREYIVTRVVTVLEK